MSILPSMMPYNAVWTQGAARVLCLNWKITGATTVSPLPIGSQAGALVTFTAISSQSTINSFLGTTDEFLIAAFDATAMGADAMGVIVNMGGQAENLIGVESLCYSNTGATLVSRGTNAASALTASTLTTECALGAYGNIAFKIDWGNTPDFDALTSGWIVSKIYLISK